MSGQNRKNSKGFKTSLSKYVNCVDPHPSGIDRGREESGPKGIFLIFVENIRDSKKHWDGQLRITLEINFFVGIKVGTI